MKEKNTQNDRVKRFAKKLVVGYLALMIFVVSTAPLTAQAVLPVSITEDLTQVRETVVQETITKPAKIVWLQVAWNFMEFVTQRIAYDAAVLLATAGSGQQPLYEWRDNRTYFRAFVEDAAGEAIGALSDAINDSVPWIRGLNLCTPQPLFTLAFQLGLKSSFDRPEPRCDFNQIVTDWGAFIEESQAQAENPSQWVLNTFINNLSPSSNDFAVGVQLYSDVFTKVNEEKSTGFAELLASGGYKDAVDFVTGQITTPSNLIEEQWTNATLGASTQAEAERRFADIRAVDSSLWLQLGLSTLSTFTNVLLSSLTERIYTGLFDIQLEQLTGIDVADPLGSFGQFGAAEAEEHFRSLFSVNPVSLDSYSVLTEFITCPQFSTTRQLNNCVLDPNFAQAIGSADAGDPYTLSEAISEGLINGGWPLISPEDPRNIDDDCYTYGFCYANLVRLRKARIIPIGWEIAAQLQRTGESESIQTIMDQFNTCNEDGLRDPQHPYCHLIDPNWVLKYPKTQCRVQVPGQLISPEGNSRGNECVDAPSCIEEDAGGNCIGGYGHCLREKNTWQFRGDVCPAHFATCLTVTNPEGDRQHVLMNTTEPNSCDESSAGCFWYATEKVDTGDGFDWPDNPSDPVEYALDQHEYRQRVYFNREVEECDARDGGCRQLIEKTDDVTLNLVRNPSFERDENGDSIPDGWRVVTRTGGGSDPLYATPDVSPDPHAAFGTDSVNPGGGGFMQTDIQLQQGAFYTLSFYAAQPNDTASNSLDVQFRIRETTGSEGIDLNGTSFSETCRLHDREGDGRENGLVMTVTPASETPERFFCSFSVPFLSDPSYDVIMDYLQISTNNQSEDVFIDAVQLEPDEQLDDYRDGYGTAVENLSLSYYKVPPAYLGCEGRETDPEECNNYAPVCSALDVGCELYTPTNGNPSVPGIVSTNDRCPAECSGYDTFKQEPTLYEPDGAFPVHFIPATAVQCSESYVGCDEFTNLNNENVEYYTYLRACLAPDQTTENEVYYTWEGSDREGFQLVSWELLGSNLTDAPCTGYTTQDDTITCNDDVVIDDATCNDHDDIFTNPDCREFYDAEGDIHYRLFSQTVSITNDCNPYRKTTTVGADVVERQANCQAAQGFWDQDLGQCRFFGYPELSVTCPADQNGCRKYTGGTGRNSSIVFQDDMEDADIDEYVVTNGAASISNESLATDGHSIRLEHLGGTGSIVVGIARADVDCSEGDGCDLVDANGDGVTEECGEVDGCEVARGDSGFSCIVSENEIACGPLVGGLVQGKTYSVSLWAKGDAPNTPIDIDFLLGDGSPQDLEGEQFVGLDWREYSFGPFDSTNHPTFGETTTLRINTLLGGGGGDLFVDNITLRQAEENITVVKDSWVTPSVCDQTLDGSPFPQYHLGCQEYRDSNSTTHFLKSFTRLCEEKQVGCSAFYDTKQSASPYGETYQAACYFDWNTQTPVTEATPCEVDGRSVCTIPSGKAFCLFDTDTAYPMFYRDQLAGAAYAADQTDYVGNDVAVLPETQVVQGDNLVFIVARSEHQCAVGAMGCEEVGVPTHSQDKTQVDSWSSNHILNLPDEYSTQLCSHETLFCDAWDTTQDGTYYFKNPLDKTCDYRTGVELDGVVYDGWFRTGSNEFCYGQGTCTESGFTCQEDWQCADSPTDVCEIEEGTFISGGDQSEMWRNGDVDYLGWVGLCESRYDLCTEFIDPLDVNVGQTYSNARGESYVFIDNERVSDENLTPSKQCSGKVSQPRGCVLFNDVLDSELKYNASATYILSTHAATFFAGANPLDPVDPVSCPDGGVFTNPDGTITHDFCRNRCQYRTELLHPFSGETGTTNTTACYIDSDCPVLTSDAGDPVPGTCVGGAQLDNDTNIVKKVNLDRACAEWLSCDVESQVYQEDSASYDLICERVAVCREYEENGDATRCSEIVNLSNVPAVPLDANDYAARDTTWYGNEYSGASIPNMVPSQFLSQINVNPQRHCVSTSTNEPVRQTVGGEFLLPYIDCTADAAVCPAGSTCRDADSDYRLVLEAGECPVTPGIANNCTVQFCSQSGNPCRDDSACEVAEGEFCAYGFCTYRVGGGPPVSCNVDAECAGFGDGVACIDGECRERSATACRFAFGDTDCDVPEYSDPETFCTQSASTKTGLCLNGLCLLSPYDQDEVDDEFYGREDRFEFHNTEGRACKGWPESTSPFTNEIVLDWVDPITGGDPVLLLSDSVPRTVKSTFESVEVCMPNESCLCQYDKQIYGSNTYYSDVGGTNYQWRCVGGAYDGASCADADGELRSPGIFCQDGGGSCQRRTETQSYFGLDGMCLERDTSLTINGNPDENACLTWLSVDRLIGSTDIYAGKEEEAGYPLEATYYCAEQDLFTTLRPSKIVNNSAVGSVACASKASNCPADRTPDDCAQNAQCPAGYYAIVGRCANTKNDSEAGNPALACVGPTDYINDCPYVCIPYDSVRPSDGSLCVPPFGSPTDTAFPDPWFNRPDWDNPDPPTYGNDVYVLGAATELWQYINDSRYLECELKGVHLGDYKRDSRAQFLEDYWDYDGNAELDGPGNGFAFASLEFPSNAYYPACVTMVQSSNTSGNYAYTDRLLGPGTTFAIDSSFDSNDPTDHPDLEYTQNTDTIRYGKSIDPVLHVQQADDPVPVTPIACLGTVSNAVPNRNPVDDFLGLTLHGEIDTADYVIVAPEITDPTSQTYECPPGYTRIGNWLGDPIARSFTEGVIDPDTGFGDWNPLLGGADQNRPVIAAGPDQNDQFNLEPFVSDVNNIMNRIGQLFAAITDVTGTIYRYDDGWDRGDGPASGRVSHYGRYDSEVVDSVWWPGRGTETGYLTTGDNRYSPQGPFVKGVTSNCVGGDCVEGSVGDITINSQEFGDQTGAGTFVADLRFHAYAGQEQMPLRRVLIDWGDGFGPVGSTDDNNYYKNHRGLNTQQQEICGNGTNWTVQPEACTTAAFGSTKYYSCSEGYIVQLPACFDGDSDGFYDEYPCNEGELACVFRPKVHIRDNWGWCTGTCPGGVDDTDGCFDPNLTLGSNEIDDECRWDVNALFDPWVYYDGEIRVEP